MSQEVIKLKLKDLVLWTENPRDPIEANATDQDVVDRALEDRWSRWNLKKLAEGMGDHYDFSELPTVVFHGKKPVVYDGNRRVILGKLKHGLVSVKNLDVTAIPKFPIEIPCNVCSKDVALQNIDRKHAESGSWLPLERDIFLHKHMGQPKTPFLILEESTGIVSANPHLNQRFVKEEIFREDILNDMGISFSGSKILSKHSAAVTSGLLDDISQKISEKIITTRKNRGEVIKVLSPSNQKIVAEHKNNKAQEVNLRSKRSLSGRSSNITKSRRVRTKSKVIFGGPLYLRIGSVSNLYRDIVDLNGFYLEKKESLSEVFPCLIRMALRLLCESAAKDCGQEMDKYVKTRFQKIKGKLDQNAKTTLSNNNVTETSIIQLLHTGAHNYTAAANLDQTLAVSIVIGALLSDSHGKAVEK